MAYKLGVSLEEVQEIRRVINPFLALPESHNWASDRYCLYLNDKKKLDRVLEWCCKLVPSRSLGTRRENEWEEGEAETIVNQSTPVDYTPEQGFQLQKMGLVDLKGDQASLSCELFLEYFLSILPI